MMKPTGYAYNRSATYPGPRPIMLCCCYGTYREENHVQRVLLYALQEVSQWDGSTPRGTPGGPQVESKF